MTEPIRMCVACRRRAPKGELVRLVVHRGTVAVDPHARRPGRGAYLCGREQCLARALGRGGAALHRALRAEPGEALADVDALRDQWARAIQESSTTTAGEIWPTPVRETA